MYHNCTECRILFLLSTVQLPTSDAPPTDATPTDKAPPTEEDKEVEKTISNNKQQLRTSVSLDEDDFKLQTPNKYLTIIRGDDDDIKRSYTDAGMLASSESRKKGVGPPAVPPRRRR